MSLLETIRFSAWTIYQARASRLPPWRVLALQDNRLRRLLESPHLGELKVLYLHDTNQPDADLAFLVEHPRLASLTHLYAVGCGLTPDGMRTLGATQGLPALRAPPTPPPARPTPWHCNN